ncbi:MAG: hypothetical protein HY264_07155 [Chloroflexi bacterium]|nr:hypothetical protein [Chloroflexota bacterium]
MIGRSGLGLLARDIVALTPSYLIPGLASLVAVPVLFSLLGPSGYGLWALIFGIANGVPQLTTSWLESLILRFGHRRGHRIGAVTYAAAGATSAIGGGALALVFIPGANLLVVAVTVALTLGVGGYLILAARLQSLLAFGDVSLVASIRSIAGVILSVTLAALTHDASVAALGLAGGFAIGMLGGIARARRRNVDASTDPARYHGGAADGPPHVAGSGGNEKLTYGLASGFFAIGMFILAVGDRFILSAVRPLAELGVYAATYSIVDLAFRLAPSVVVTTVRQRLFRAWDLGDHRRAIELTSAGFSLIAWLSAWLVVVVVLIAPVGGILPIDRQLVGPLSAGLAAFVVANVLVILYSAQVRQPRVAAHVVSAAIINVGLNLALDPALGAGGAALATVISYAAYLAFNGLGLRDVITGQRPSGVIALVVSAATAVAAILHPTLGPLPLAAAAVALAVSVPAVLQVARSVVAAPRDAIPAPLPTREG